MAQLHHNTQPNMAVKEAMTVIGKAITARDYASKKDRARAACQQKDSENKKFAFTHETVVTNCGIYNATGDSMKIVCYKNWNGQVQPFYPQEIGNGQWGLFVHTKRPMVPEGSKAAVVYRVKDVNGNECDWMCAWNNPPKKEQSTTHAYTQIREVGHFTDNIWPTISKALDEAGHESTDTQSGCTTEVSITDGSPAAFSAVITIEN